MPITPADTGGGYLGWLAGLPAQHYAHRQEIKQQLADEKRQNDVTDLYNQQAGILANLQLPGLSDEQQKKYTTDLADVRGRINSIYDPIKAPGALQKDWEHLKGLITRHKTLPPQAAAVIEHETMPATEPVEPVTIKMPNGEQITLPAIPATPRLDTYKVGEPPPPPPPRNEYERRTQAARQHAEREAQALIRAMPPSLSQQVQAKVAAYKQLNPDATPEEIQRITNELFEMAATGVKTPPKAKWKFGTAMLPDQKTRVTVRYDETSGAMEIAATGEPVPPGTMLETSAAAKGYKYNSQNNVITGPDGKPYFKNDPNNPEEVKRMFESADQTRQEREEFQIRQTRERGSAYNETRMVDYHDNKTGVEGTMEWGKLKKLNEDEPGRYVTTKDYKNWAAGENVLEDLRGSSRIVRNVVKQVQQEGGFSAAQQAALYSIYENEHPRSALDTAILMGTLGSLTPAQKEYLIATTSLTEQAMGMRSILGAGQGSDMVRNAIRQTIPGFIQDQDMALRQLDYFDGTLERVHRIIPTNIRLGPEDWTVGERPANIPGGPAAIPLTGDTGVGGYGSTGGGGTAGATAPPGQAAPPQAAAQGPPPTQAGTAGPNGAVSLAEAKKLHPGWSDQQVIADLWSHGLGWTP